MSGHQGSAQVVVGLRRRGSMCGGFVCECYRYWLCVCVCVDQCLQFMLFHSLCTCYLTTRPLTGGNPKFCAPYFDSLLTYNYLVKQPDGAFGLSPHVSLVSCGASVSPRRSSLIDGPPSVVKIGQTSDCCPPIGESSEDVQGGMLMDTLDVHHNRSTSDSADLKRSNDAEFLRMVIPVSASISRPLLSRFDRLSIHHQQSLQVASVLCMAREGSMQYVFNVGWLRSVVWSCFVLLHRVIGWSLVGCSS